MINQLMLHAEKRSEIHLRMVGNGDHRSIVPVVALRLPTANFSNRFAVEHTNHYDVHNLNNLAIDNARAHDLSLNRNSRQDQNLRN